MVEHAAVLEAAPLSHMQSSTLIKLLQKFTTGVFATVAM